MLFLNLDVYEITEFLLLEYQRCNTKVVLKCSLTEEYKLKEGKIIYKERNIILEGISQICSWRNIDAFVSSFLSVSILHWYTKILDVDHLNKRDHLNK